jgi:hypothetical protein
VLDASDLSVNSNTTNIVGNTWVQIDMPLAYCTGGLSLLHGSFGSGQALSIENSGATMGLVTEQVPGDGAMINLCVNDRLNNSNPAAQGGMFRVDNRNSSPGLGRPPMLFEFISKPAGGADTIVAYINRTGDLNLNGNISAFAKFFKIDHPSDPANKYLVHACIESNEAFNMYRGNVTLEDGGTATIILPDWMEDLNENFSYQLTPVGAWAPLYVASELHNHEFSIAGGQPGMKVSWVVTGVRKDAYMKAHPMQVEQDKGADRGKYLRPELFGAGPEKAIGTIPSTQADSTRSETTGN